MKILNLRGIRRHDFALHFTDIAVPLDYQVNKKNDEKHVKLTFEIKNCDDVFLSELVP